MIRNTHQIQQTYQHPQVAKALVVPIFQDQLRNVYVLVVQDVKSKDWTFPGGGCKSFETNSGNVIACAERELSEETYGAFTKIHGPYQHFSFDIEMNRLFMKQYVYIYRVKKEEIYFRSNMIDMKEETCDMRWILLSSLTSNNCQIHLWSYLREQVLGHLVNNISEFTFSSLKSVNPNR